MTNTRFDFAKNIRSREILSRPHEFDAIRIEYVPKVIPKGCLDLLSESVSQKTYNWVPRCSRGDRQKKREIAPVHLAQVDESDCPSAREVYRQWRSRKKLFGAAVEFIRYQRSLCEVKLILSDRTANETLFIEISKKFADEINRSNVHSFATLSSDRHRRTRRQFDPTLGFRFLGVVCGYCLLVASPISEGISLPDFVRISRLRRDAQRSR